MKTAAGEDSHDRAVAAHTREQASPRVLPCPIHLVLQISKGGLNDFGKRLRVDQIRENAMQPISGAAGSHSHSAHARVSVKWDHARRARSPSAVTR